MTRIYMIRHGKAAAGWDGDADPGLNELGRSQSAAVAEAVQALVGAPAPLYTSPLKRCQETAIPLAQAWGATPSIELGVSEIPPPIEDLTQRTDWLRRVMAGTWQDLYDDPVSQASGLDFKGWFDAVPRALNAMAAQGEHVVVFSHFIALNVAYCAATSPPAEWGAQDVISFAPQNCSLNIFETDGQTLTLVQQGEETDDMKIALGKKA
jgi:broad specificity phosphatase PhoE